MTILVALAAIAPATYMHEISHGGTRLTVRNEQTGKVIWWRTVSETPHVSWTPDRRAMIALHYSDDLISWRAGGRVERIAYAPRESDQGEAPGPAASPVISPNGKFAAVFMPQSMGAGILEIHMAFVVDLDKRKSIRLPNPEEPGSYLRVRSMRWADEETLFINEVTRPPTEEDRTIGLAERKWVPRNGTWARSEP